MIESLRGVGYSVETAVADLVDNSIAASARTIRLDFHFDGPDSWMTLLDDGRGMGPEELRSAMTVGGRSPLETRSSGDLGRFGMGLKTASFSQCRCLTVATLPESGALSVRRWDLDYIARPDVNEWRLLTGPSAGSEARLAGLASSVSGTLVLWERLDRITAGLTHDRRSQDAFFAMVARVEQHLAMVFHRYLEGPGARLRIHVGGAARLRPWDPFLSAHPATEPTPVERIPAPGGAIQLQGFVLPHRDQLDDETWRRAAGRDGWVSQQGFYVYRNDRLLVAGGWLGLGEPRVWTREEPFKLARLAVSFSNSGDAAWEVDIRKSVARPPRAVRPRLTALADSVRTVARQVFAHRGAYGKRAPVSDLVPAWLSATGRRGVTYRVNRDHPVMSRVRENLGHHHESLEDLLRIVESTVPVQRIWLDAVEQGEVQSGAEPLDPDQIDAMERTAKALIDHLTSRVGLEPTLVRARLLATEPFQNHPEVIDRLLPPSTETP
ncbi:MAG: ATP-binding protein [Alphaproteobacteria bacterium]|nr:ATP-binding protein [Alphaproteobacteria bacterium]MBU1512489.1 ATP-binding protein [Alphaproteobacteria bacterium]MBU2096587.1 ATP-binding protein [Alphaproteobacteria bacterium]MBU2151595.1 ATP-binding protein [Alphaproteobacteria bacterium]MBU2307313.1 ATP-binding protein [Alphaproteobacteria bacterium]